MESTRRQSKKRDAIREILLASYDHPSVEEIYRRLKPDIPDLSLGTVYRNLALFREEGKAMSVATVAGQERFDGRTHPHAHFICEKCGRHMVIKMGRYGKFLACPGFPECTNTKRLVKDTGGKCPKCGGRMLLRRSAKGRVYYGCENYPNCDFMTWDEPVPTTCDKCGATLFRKGGKLYCAKDGGDFEKQYVKGQTNE